MWDYAECCQILNFALFECLTQLHADTFRSSAGIGALGSLVH